MIRSSMPTAAFISPQPLRLRPGGASTDAAVAWLLTGGDAAAWLREIVRWQVPLTSVRLLVLPSSLSDATPCGALAICDVPPRVAPGPWAIAYRAAAPLLFTPLGTTFAPPVSEAELRERVVWPCAVFHPGVGLVGCRTEDLVRAIDLIAPAAPAATHWNDATAAPAGGRGINMLRPAQDEASDQMLAALRDDIASAPPGELPPLPQESTLRRWLDRAKMRAAKAVGGVAGKAGKDSAVGRLGAWAQRQAAALAENLDAARAKELSRLLNLLDADPDQGLRYALPLGGGNAARGVSPPSARLGAHDTNFSNKTPTGPGDAWKVEAAVQERLRARYRALAARELGLGRFRRAAYVFASLLLDYSAAANALEQGHFWREAAALYQEKLRQHLRAAECLQKGGLIHEAIAIYLTLQLHEKIGDLYTLIGRPADAAAAYRAAVDQHVARDDVLAAAHLLEHRLAVPDEALVRLTAAWPDSKQADACLRASYVLLARLDRHDEARDRVNAVRAAAHGEVDALALSDVLADVAVTYPAGPVRHAAGDAVRLLAGHHVAAFNPALKRRVLSHVSRAGGDDALLARDIERFLSGSAAPTIPAPVPKFPTPGRRGPRVVRSFNLGAAGKFSAWTGIVGGFVAIAPTGRDDEIELVRSSWQGPAQTLRLRCPNAGLTSWRIAAQGFNVRLFTVGPTLEFGNEAFAAALGFPVAGVVDGRPAPDAATYGVAVGPDGRLHWLGSPHGSPPGPVVHNMYNARNELIDTADTTIAIPHGAPCSSMHLVVQSDVPIFSAGRKVFTQRRDRPAHVFDLPREIRGMSGPAASHAMLRVTVDFAQGAAIVWPVLNVVAEFAQDMVDPVTLLLRDGVIVAIDNTRGRVYDVIERQPRLRQTFKPDPGVVALMELNTAGEFASLNRSGQVTVYTVE